MCVEATWRSIDAAHPAQAGLAASGLDDLDAILLAPRFGQVAIFRIGEYSLLVRAVIAALLVLGALAPAASARLLVDPVAHAASTCSDCPNQAAAQRAADTRDGDGDGVYCVISTS